MVQHQILGLTILSFLNFPISSFKAVTVHGCCIRRTVRLQESSQPTRTDADLEDDPATTQKNKSLGLLSFDLDDTLFPIRPVVEDANEAQMKFMNEKASADFTVADFLLATKRIRMELSQPITYTELRKRAIAELMGSNEFVEDAFDVWLLERQASANRNLYADAIDTLDILRLLYPDIPFIAITNGRGDPREMPKLCEYFNDCISGEDTNVRKPDPRIYERALEGIDLNNSCWVHVGDCLANDVGASASCGALAVWLERPIDGVAEWSTATTKDILERRKQQDAAQEKIAVKIQELLELPAAIEDLLGGQMM